MITNPGCLQCDYISALLSFFGILISIVFRLPLRLTFACKMPLLRFSRYALARSEADLTAAPPSSCTTSFFINPALAAGEPSAMSITRAPSPFQYPVPVNPVLPHYLRS